METEVRMKPQNAALMLTVLLCVPVSFWVGVLFANIFPGLNERAVHFLIDTAVAIGTIGAVVVALTVGKQQARAAMQAVREAHSLDAKGRKEGIVSVGEAAHAFAERIDRIFSTPGIEHLVLSAQLYNIYDKSIVEGIAFALITAPAHEIGSREGVLALVLLRQQFDLLWKTVDKYLENPWDDPDSRKSLESYPDPGGNEERAKMFKQIKDARANNVRLRIRTIASAYDALKDSLDGAQASKLAVFQ